jgi:VCBS repeat-containing protein
VAGAVLVSGLGTVSVSATGQWTYNLNNANAAVQALDAAQTITDSFTLTTTDGTTQLVTVTITGAEDLSTVTAGSVTTGAVSEDNVAVATGDLNSADVDVGDADDAWAVIAGAASVGGFGTFSVTAAGVWTYNLTNGAANVQALDAGVTVTDTFTVSTTDLVAQQVTVTITGAEDPVTLTAAPVFTAAGVAFTATDADNEALSLVNSVNGVSAVVNGGPTNLVVQQQAAVASSTDLAVTDGESPVLDLGVTLLQGTGNADVLDGSALGEPAAIYGFGGADTLIGGADTDTLFGGAGADTFAMGDPTVTGNDVIGDFVSATDFISFDVAAVNVATGSAFVAGAVAAGNLVSGAGAVAVDGDDFFVYDTASGVFSFDADGNGAGASVAIATLTGNPALLVTDLLYV